MYRGRFAPSPTGPLHFGSLVAAVGSFLEAKTQGGEWLVRIEDIDTLRNVPGATESILHSLTAFGMAWDGAVLFQSARSDAYGAALDQLRARGMVYGCGCTRREIADSVLHNVDGMDGPVYPGTCRDGLPAGRVARATRVRTQGARVTFEDAVQGVIFQDIEHEVGDFVIRRADAVTAYQLAVVVDDAAQGITTVVRGADLLQSTPRQILLQRLLGLPTPLYAHLPVAINDSGEKLSKQTLAPAINPERPVPELLNVLSFLGQEPPLKLQHAQVAQVWKWAIAHWRHERIPARRTLVATGYSA